MVKAAIFDMDGLLIDSERIIMHACIAAAADIGITYTQAEFVQLIGRAGADSTRLLVQQLGSQQAFNQVMEGLDERLASTDHAFPLKSGVMALLAYYQQQGVVCSVASSSPMTHIQHRLAKAEVLDYFEHLTSGHEVQNGKPNPDIYLLAMQKLGLKASDCIAFEDSEPGARAAIAAGLDVVVVPDLKQPSDFVRQQAHQVVDSLDLFYEMTSQSMK